MAKVHYVGRRSRRTKSFFMGAKSLVSSIFLIAGSAFSAVTILSIAMQLANLVLNSLLGLKFMQARFIQELYRCARMWTAYLGNFVLRMIDLVDRITDSGSGTAQSGLELVKELGLLLLAMVAVIGTLMVVFRFGSILRYAGSKLNTPGSGEEGGMRGEREALKLLKRLPGDAHVFVNLEFEKRGHHETDFIVVAPAGVTVCEVKYWSGRVIYDAADNCNVTRIDNRGNVRSMHSPVHQVIAHYETLRDALKDQGINANPRGMVLMMHPDVRLEGFQNCRVPVLKRPSPGDVAGRLGHAQLSGAQIDQTVQALKRIAL